MAFSEVHRSQNIICRALDDCRELNGDMLDEAQGLRSGNLVQVRLKGGRGVFVHRRSVCLVERLDEPLKLLFATATSSTGHSEGHASQKAPARRRGGQKW